MRGQVPARKLQLNQDRGPGGIYSDIAKGHWGEFGRTGNGNFMRVMIIDDQLYFRSPMVRLLEQRGFRVVACRNSVEAREQAELDDRIAVAFVELNLPEVCGIEIAAQLRRVAPWMTVYLTTATDRATTPEDWSGDGIAGILQKPIPMHQLAELCTESIERCRLAFEAGSGPMSRFETNCAGSSQ